MLLFFLRLALLYWFLLSNDLSLFVLCCFIFFLRVVLWLIVINAGYLRIDTCHLKSFLKLSSDIFLHFIIDIVPGLFSSQSCNASFFFLYADLGEITIKCASYTIHNGPKLATLLQEFILDVILEFMGIFSVKLVDCFTLSLRCCFNIFRSIFAQEFQSHVLIALEVLNRSIILFLKCFVNFENQLVLELCSFQLFF